MNWTAQEINGAFPIFGRSLETQRNAEQMQRVSTVLESPEFLRICKALGLPPTRRQASKFLKKRGSVYDKRNG